ncbi:MAG: hypothetical protein WCF90_10405 [Methanomicrobiales archaeon]
MGRDPIAIRRLLPCYTRYNIPDLSTNLGEKIGSSPKVSGHTDPVCVIKTDSRRGECLHNGTSRPDVLRKGIGGWIEPVFEESTGKPVDNLSSFQGVMKQFCKR